MIDFCPPSLSLSNSQISENKISNYASYIYILVFCSVHKINICALTHKCAHYHIWGKFVSDSGIAVVLENFEPAGPFFHLAAFFH